MKKNIFTLLFLALCVTAHADYKIDDFENSGKVWSNVSCWTEQQANPSKTGINLSDNVQYLIRAVGCENWSGAIYTLPQTVSGYKYLHAHIYRNNTNVPNIKVKDETGAGVSCEGNGYCDLTPIGSMVQNQWQDVVWDISQYETSGIDFVFFMVDRTDITADAVMYIDNIILSNDETPRTEVIGGESSGGEGGTELGSDYTLVWSDEFDGNGLNLDYWNIETNGDGGGNNELQYYCDRGVSVSNGNLILTATKETYQGKTCTSGRINSQGKVYFKYGKVEAKIKMPQTANGLWPAFWMMGNDINQVGWPQCGEIDIVEMGNVNGINSGTQDRYFNGAYHWGTAWNDHRQYARDYTASYSVQDGQYHIFTCVWDEDAISMYLDNASTPYCTMTIPASTDNSQPGYYFHKANHILLNLAVGGDFPAIHNINNITALSSGSASMYIDYVRVYQKGTADINYPYYNPTSLENTTTSADLLRAEYYDLQGRRLSEPAQRGITIEKLIYTDGTTQTRKRVTY